MTTVPINGEFEFDGNKFRNWQTEIVSNGSYDIGGGGYHPGPW